MFEREFGEASIGELAEEHYVAPSVELGVCDCPEEHQFSVAPAGPIITAHTSDSI